MVGVVMRKKQHVDLPDVASWMAVELLAGFAQYTVFGVLLDFVYRRQPSAAMV
jgi:hypothetical protein